MPRGVLEQKRRQSSEVTSADRQTDRPAGQGKKDKMESRNQTPPERPWHTSVTEDTLREEPCSRSHCR